jgi:hypothetical protein
MIGCRHWQSILVGSGIARGQDAIPCVRHRPTRWRNRDGITSNSSENTSNAAPFHKGKEEISLASHAACPFPRSPSSREDRSTLRGGERGGGARTSAEVNSRWHLRRDPMGGCVVGHGGHDILTTDFDIGHRFPKQRTSASSGLT